MSVTIMFVIVTFHFVAYLDSSICRIFFFMLESYVKALNGLCYVLRRKIHKMKIKFLKPLEVMRVVCYNRKMTVIMDKYR